MGDNDSRLLAVKKSALIYITAIFRSKNVDRIRACFDFKIHLYIEKYLFCNPPMNIKLEALNIMKEISFGLVDLDELSWIFGNNYNKIMDKTISNKSEPIENIEESSIYLLNRLGFKFLND